MPNMLLAQAIVVCFAWLVFVPISAAWLWRAAFLDDLPHLMDLLATRRASGAAIISDWVLGSIICTLLLLLNVGISGANQHIMDLIVALEGQVGGAEVGFHRRI